MKSLGARSYSATVIILGRSRGIRKSLITEATWSSDKSNKMSEGSGRVLVIPAANKFDWRPNKWGDGQMGLHLHLSQTGQRTNHTTTLIIVATNKASIAPRDHTYAGATREPGPSETEETRIAIEFLGEDAPMALPRQLSTFPTDCVLMFQ